MLSARLDVDEDVGHLRELSANGVLNPMGDVVGVADGQARIDFDVHIDKITIADFANDAFFDSFGAEELWVKA